MRIAWLLLSLSSLFHSICSESTSENPPTTTEVRPITDGSTSQTPTLQTVATKISDATLATTTAELTTGITTVTNPTSVPTQTQTQAQFSLTNNTSATSENNNTTPLPVANATATFSPPKTTIPATTAAAATASTVVPATTTGSGHLLLTTATARQQTTTHPTTASEISKGDTEKTTITVSSNGRGTSGPTQPAGKPETTNIHPTLTTRVDFAPENTSGTTSEQTTTSMAITTQYQFKRFQYSLNNNKHETEKDEVLEEVCKQLMTTFQDGTCTLILRQQNDKVQFTSVEINGKVRPSLATQHYEEELSKRRADNKTLIAILASCGALLIMIFILAMCASHHRRPYSENQQHLTEELHTVESGYHDNPTLEVMEVQPEMQEKKVALNGEFSDSWIVPIDNLIKEDLPDEEDTHL